MKIISKRLTQQEERSKYSFDEMTRSRALNSKDLFSQYLKNKETQNEQKPQEMEFAIQTLSQSQNDFVLKPVQVKQDYQSQEKIPNIIEQDIQDQTIQQKSKNQALDSLKEEAQLINNANNSFQSVQSKFKDKNLSNSQDYQFPKVINNHKLSDGINSSADKNQKRWHIPQLNFNQNFYATQKLPSDFKINQIKQKYSKNQNKETLIKNQSYQQEDNSKKQLQSKESQLQTSEKSKKETIQRIDNSTFEFSFKKPIEAQDFVSKHLQNVQQSDNYQLNKNQQQEQLNRKLFDQDQEFLDFLYSDRNQDKQSTQQQNKLQGSDFNLNEKNEANQNQNNDMNSGNFCEKVQSIAQELQQKKDLNKYITFEMIPLNQNASDTIK